MCTLILGVDVAGPGTVVAGANRDEDPSRPSDPPMVLREHPRVVGGRDRRAGGTWLAVREGRALVAMLNRRDAGPPVEGRRSRGLLALEAAAVPDAPRHPLSRATLDHALEALGRAEYAPFSMVFASPKDSWWLAHDPGQAPRVKPIPPGWHVLTHTDLDDAAEPRAARLLRELGPWRPRSAEEALHGLAERLREHGSGGSNADAVCIHDGRMVTVSSTRVWLGPGGARTLHVEGRPCEAGVADVTPLVTGVPIAEEHA